MGFTALHYFIGFTALRFHIGYSAFLIWFTVLHFIGFTALHFLMVYSASFSEGLQRYIFLGLQGFIFFIEVTGLYILHRGYRASFLYGVQPLINIWVTVLHFHRGCCA